jgi:hypothetical protein
VSDGGPPLDVKEESAARKLLTGLFVALGSFTASSPHFMLNLLTVFSCSLALVSLAEDSESVLAFLFLIAHVHVIHFTFVGDECLSSVHGDWTSHPQHVVCKVVCAAS